VYFEGAKPDKVNDVLTGKRLFERIRCYRKRIIQLIVLIIIRATQ